MHPEHDACPFTIQQALEAFSLERRTTLDSADYRAYRRVLFFLELCINNYGHRNLDEKERAHFERCFHAEGSDKRHFFEIFGPSKLLPELDFFAHSYVRTDVFTSERIESIAPAVVSDLTRWLVERGYASASEVDASVAGYRAQLALKTRARRVARLLARRAVAVDPHFFSARDYIATDDHTILRVEAGKLWLRVYRSPEPEDIGPLTAPLAATRTLRVGWSLCCGLARVRGRWQLVDVDDVYPRMADTDQPTVADTVCAGGRTNYNRSPVRGEQPSQNNPTKTAKSR